MATWLTNRLINFMMSWWPFEKKKNKEKTSKTNSGWEVFKSKSDYVSKVTEFLESGVKEMKKDIRKF